MAQGSQIVSLLPRFTFSLSSFSLFLYSILFHTLLLHGCKKLKLLSSLRRKKLLKRSPSHEAMTRIEEHEVELFPFTSFPSFSSFSFPSNILSVIDECIKTSGRRREVLLVERPTDHNLTHDRNIRKRDSWGKKRRKISWERKGKEQNFERGEKGWESRLICLDLLKIHPSITTMWQDMVSEWERNWEQEGKIERNREREREREREIERKKLKGKEKLEGKRRKWRIPRGSNLWSSGILLSRSLSLSFQVSIERMRPILTLSLSLLKFSPQITFYSEEGESPNPIKFLISNGEGWGRERKK